MNNVVRLPRRKDASEQPGPMPASLPNDQLHRLFTLAHRWGFVLEEVYYATSMVRGWYEGNPSSRKRADWVMVILNAMRAGWALRGYPVWLERRGKNIFPTVRSGTALATRPLTREIIEQVIGKLNARRMANSEGEGRERAGDRGLPTIARLPGIPD